eukprot:GFUD01039687.1.p1 GENE.GFUD01039687.1~~GFUD01039687.1.p1  ORF type:complete len:155 (-),score=22.80 GFUD01039687.1:338-802(-)
MENKMNSTLGNSFIAIRHSKTIWKPSLYNDEGTIDMERNTFEHFKTNYSSVETIAFEHYAFSALVVVIVILGLSSLYVCFWRWVAKGNLDLPTFGGGGQLVFKCFSNRNGLRKTESTQVLQDSLEIDFSQGSFENTTVKEDKDSAEVLEFSDVE